MKADKEARKKAVFEALSHLNFLRGFPTSETSLRLCATAVARFASDQQVTHEKLGEVNPLDWLIDEISATCEFFPPPIKMRKIYQQYFGPLDGMTAEELESE